MLILEILGIVLVLSVLVVVHELGHLFVAKKLGVWAEEFGVGLPPRIWGKKIGETLYSLNLIPLGGFVKLHGETGDERVIDTKRAFVSQPHWKKILIAIAGVVMNFVFGVVAFGTVYTITGIPQEVETGKVAILDIEQPSPAHDAGIIAGDVVRKIDKQEITTDREFRNIIETSANKKVVLEIERKEDEQLVTKKISITPKKDDQTGKGLVGVYLTSTEIRPYFAPQMWKRPLLGAKYGLEQSIALIGMIFNGFGRIGQEISRGKVPADIAGPSKLGALIIYVIRQGLVPLVNLMGLISINLAIFNLLPIPPLDGSRVVISLTEWITRRRLPGKIEYWMHTVGMALLLLLVLAVTFKEVPEFIKAGNITNFVEGFLK